MKKNGFTLIELLSVVVLVALVSAIIIPNIFSSINKKRGQISEVNMNLLSQATNVYIDNHSNVYASGFEASGSVYCIPIQSLINDGVLETPFIDSTGREIDYSNVVKATYSSSNNGFSYQVVEPSACTEFINYVNRPQLASNMIPVINDSGVWKKADVNSKWYDYSDKNWANAVVVKCDVRSNYIHSVVGTTIDENDILGYFVWIPRFKYQLFSSNSNVPISIAFEGVGFSKSSGSSSGEWLTHPAFTYSSQELSGIWVGKYESSNSSDSILIKPSLTAWTNISYNDSYNKVVSMTDRNNMYGFSGLDTHLMRNSEWGAVAYLTNSSYGNFSNNSTTGNITGIYNLTGNKEFVQIDNQNESSLGYSLNETNSWVNGNTYVTSQNVYLTRGSSSLFSYQNINLMDSSTTFRAVLVNINAME